MGRATTFGDRAGRRRRRWATRCSSHLAGRGRARRRRALPRHRLPLRRDARHPRRRTTPTTDVDAASTSCRCRRSPSRTPSTASELLRPRPEPVLRAAQGRAARARPCAATTAWVTGLRREEAPTRAEHPGRRLGRQARHGQAQPARRLDRGRRGRATSRSTGCWSTRCARTGYASIGCAPCTRAVAPGEDPRAGPLGRHGQDRVRAAHMTTHCVARTADRDVDTRPTDARRTGRSSPRRSTSSARWRASSSGR